MKVDLCGARGGFCRGKFMITQIVKVIRFEAWLFIISRPNSCINFGIKIDETLEKDIGYNTDPQ